MVVSLARMLKSLSQTPEDLIIQAAEEHAQSQTATTSHQSESSTDTTQQADSQTQANSSRIGDASSPSATVVDELLPKRADHAQRTLDALAQVKNVQTPTPLTDRYLANRQQFQPSNRPPFNPDTLWYLKHGHCPIMTELIDIVDDQQLNAMPIEAVAILDRINDKLKRYREWSEELKRNNEEWVCERQFVIDKLINESIPEALAHYEQLLRFSPYRTKNNKINGDMTAGEILTNLFLEIDYELDELLDELHNIVLNRLASAHRYVKNRTQS